MNSGLGHSTVSHDIQGLQFQTNRVFFREFFLEIKSIVKYCNKHKNFCKMQILIGILMNFLEYVCVCVYTVQNVH